jgi:hypothetical protein
MERDERRKKFNRGCTPMHADKNGTDSIDRRRIPRAAKTAQCIRVNRRASAVEILCLEYSKIMIYTQEPERRQA